MLLDSKQIAQRTQPEQEAKPAVRNPEKVNHRETYVDPQEEAAKVIGYLPGISSCITREE